MLLLGDGIHRTPVEEDARRRPKKILSDSHGLSGLVILSIRQSDWRYLKKKLQQAINGRDDNDNDGVRRRSVGNFRTLAFLIQPKIQSETQQKKNGKCPVASVESKKQWEGAAVGQL